MNYLFVVSGFTQQRHATHDSGSIAIFEDLECYRSIDTIVMLMEYSDDPVGWARRVAQRMNPGDKLMACVYSYGGGWWFRKFVAELHRLGVTVDVVVMCDPVYRREVWMRFMQWRAMTKWWTQTLRIPQPNITRCVHFIQHVNKPGGDRLVLHPSVEYEGPHELDRKHVKIDNAPEYREACNVEAEKLFGPKPQVSMI